MLENWELVVISAIAFLGGVFYAFWGWIRSEEPWSTRKFGVSVGAALVAGIVFGVGYKFTESFSLKDVLLAFGAGAGFTAVAPKLADAG